MMENVIKPSQYLIGGDNLDQRFADMGFTDIKVIEQVVDIGNWREPQGDTFINM